jgi:hypothetical protein
MISSITDVHGATTNYTIGQDGGVWYAQNGGYQKLSGNAGYFNQVSAGLDSFGHAECWALGSNGHLWWFSQYAYDPNGNNVFGQDAGMVGSWCMQISAGRQDECFVVGYDRNVYLRHNAGQFWEKIDWMPTGYGATQVSAGVNRWGQDKVYILTQGGYIAEDNRDGSFNWLQNQYGQWLRGTQISAGINANNYGADRDFFYVASDSTLHYYYGSWDYGLGGWGCKQIAAADGRGGEFCVVTQDNYQHFSEVYTATIWGWNDMQRQATSVAAAADDMIFTVNPYPNNQIWCYDPHNDWSHPWWEAGSSWHYTNGIA